MNFVSLVNAASPITADYVRAAEQSRRIVAKILEGSPVSRDKIALDFALHATLKNEHGFPSKIAIETILNAERLEPASFYAPTPTPIDHSLKLALDWIISAKLLGGMQGAAIYEQATQALNLMQEEIDRAILMIDSTGAKIESDSFIQDVTAQTYGGALIQGALCIQAIQAVGYAHHVHSVMTALHPAL